MTSNPQAMVSRGLRRPKRSCLGSLSIGGDRMRELYALKDRGGWGACGRDSGQTGADQFALLIEGLERGAFGPRARGA